MAQNEMSKYRQIGFLTDAGADVNPDEYLTNPDRISRLLHEGVIYKDKKKRFWVDKNGNSCFTIFARGLNITNGDRPIYWQWSTDSDGIEVAKVIKARWLEVRGSFWTMDLTPDREYKVTFRTRMGEVSSSMGGQKVSLRLTLPDGTNQERQEALPREKSQDGSWHELEAGRLTVTKNNVGRMEFSMKKWFGAWVEGLFIGGVDIKAV